MPSKRRMRNLTSQAHSIVSLTQMRCSSAGQSQWTVELSHRVQLSLAALMPLKSHVDYKCTTDSSHQQHIEPLKSLAHRQQTAKTSQQSHEHAGLTVRQDCCAMLPPPSRSGLPQTSPIAGEHCTNACQIRHAWPKTDTYSLQSPYFYNTAWTRLA